MTETAATKEEGAVVVVLDALPYIDPVHEEYEQYAAALIQDEMKARPVAVAESVPAVRFRTPLMQHDYQELVAASGERAALHTTTATAAAVAVMAPPTGTAAQDATAWRQAVQQAKIAYETERIRSLILQVEKDGLGSAGPCWKAYNELLGQSQGLLQQALEAQQLAVEDLNHNRQQSQVQMGRKLEVLVAQYHELLQKVFSLKRAVAEMEQQQQQSV